jgi:hypothetical protein
MMHAIATTAIIAISVLISGASAVGVVGSVCVGAGAASSGSIDCAADGASPTFT